MPIVKTPMYSAFRTLRDVSKSQMFLLITATQKRIWPSHCCVMQHAKNQVHTRSQHAEERALESCDQRITVGGTLYTTSNSCELCARKAVNFGISRIVYIEPYFGITESHVLGHPQISERVHVELFTGACQRAYIQMYTPVFPLKDELKLRGIEYFTSPSRNSNAKRNNNKAHKRRGGGYRK